MVQMKIQASVDEYYLAMVDSLGKIGECIGIGGTVLFCSSLMRRKLCSAVDL